MARRTHAESLKTREEILEAAVDCFLENGVTQTSLEDIARHAGYTRGAVYYHFKNKVEIVVDLLESVMMPFEEMLQAASEREPESPLEALKPICVEVMTHLIEDDRRRRIHTILYHRCEWTKELDPVFQRMIQIKKSFLRSTIVFMNKAIQKKQLRRDLSAEQASILLQTYCQGIYWRTLLEEEFKDGPINLELAYDIFFQGIRAK